MLKRLLKQRVSSLSVLLKMLFINEGLCIVVKMPTASALNRGSIEYYLLVHKGAIACIHAHTMYIYRQEVPRCLECVYGVRAIGNGVTCFTNGWCYYNDLNDCLFATQLDVRQQATFQATQALSLLNYSVY